MPNLGLGTSLSSSGLITPGIVTDSLVLKHNYAAGGVTPVSDGAAFFDGADDYIAVGSSLGDLGSSATFCAWINRTEIGGGADYFFDSRAGSGAGFAQGYDGTTAVNVSEGTVYVDGNVSSVLPVGEWHHVAVTGMTINAHTSMLIGKYNASASQHILKGYMCNVGFWNANLTQPQIKSIMWKNYAGLNSTETTNLVSWWNLSANANDDHGSNNGTLT